MMAAHSGLSCRILNSAVCSVISTADQRAREHRFHSDALREAARSVDGVLSDLVACPNLSVREGRIYTQTVRGETLFDDAEVLDFE